MLYCNYCRYTAENKHRYNAHMKTAKHNYWLKYSRQSTKEYNTGYLTDTTTINARITNT